MHVTNRHLQFLGEVVAASGTPVILHDLEGRILAWNRGAERLYGYAADEALGMNIRELAPVEKREPAAVNPVDGDVSEGEQFVEVERVARDGSRRLVSLTRSMVRDMEGRIAGIGLIEHDITNLERANTRIRTGEANLRAILDNAVESIISIDARGAVLSANPASERLFGYAAEEMLGRNVSLLMPAPYHDAHDAYIENYLRTGVRKIIGIGREVVGRHKDGRVFPIYLSVTEISRDPVQFVGMIRDLTEYKETHSRLLHSERLAAIGQAMTGLTHESRNALSRSQANLRRLARRLTDRPDLREFIDAALRAQDEVGQLFDDVRQYAAPLTLDRQPCRLDQVLDEAWEQLSSECSVRRAILRNGGAEVDTVCELDRFSIRNALRNILQNALAACSDPVEIEATYAADELSGRPALSLTIRDNGPGIAVDVVPRLFEAFFTTKTHGTGLGLAIVRRTVEAHGGSVTTESRPGCGAIFQLTLPRNSL